VGVQIVDIRNCFPRVAYTLAGVSFPDDFYGAHDEGRAKRKTTMNVLLNTIWFDPKNKSPEKVIRAQKKAQLLRNNYHPDVVDYLLTTFFNTPFKGDFFNRMAGHEREIISQVKRKLIDIGGQSGVVRRHDSLVLFDNEADLSWLNDFEYLGVTGWFKIGEKVTENNVNFEDRNDDWEDETEFRFG
jgi:hypothetical protein